MSTILQNQLRLFNLGIFPFLFLHLNRELALTFLASGKVCGMAPCIFIFIFPKVSEKGFCEVFWQL
jgi:hypothetical protein